MSNRSDEENCVVCTCGQPALKLTVKKDGPNKGKINEAYLTLCNCKLYGVATKCLHDIPSDKTSHLESRGTVYNPPAFYPR